MEKNGNIKDKFSTINNMEEEIKLLMTMICNSIMKENFQKEK